MKKDLSGYNKFKIYDDVWFSPPKGDFVTIDYANNYEMRNHDNSVDEWCRQIHGNFLDYIQNEIANDLMRFTGFIKLWSRRYATYNVNVDDFMNDNGYDAVFVNNEEFYFCGNEVENVTLSAEEVYEETDGDFTIHDYGDDCCGWCDTYYIQKGVVYELTETKDFED